MQYILLRKAIKFVMRSNVENVKNFHLFFREEGKYIYTKKICSICSHCRVAVRGPCMHGTMITGQTHDDAVAKRRNGGKKLSLHSTLR